MAISRRRLGLPPNTKPETWTFESSVTRFTDAVRLEIQRSRGNIILGDAQFLGALLPVALEPIKPSKGEVPLRRLVRNLVSRTCLRPPLPR